MLFQPFQRSDRPFAVDLQAPLPEETQLGALGLAFLLLVFREEASDGRDPVVDVAQRGGIISRRKAWVAMARVCISST